MRKCHRDEKPGHVAPLPWIATISPVLNEVHKKVALQEGIMSPKQLEDNFDLLPDGVIVCDREGKILRANAAALKLFEVASEDLCRGVDYQQFLHGSILGDEPQRAIALEPWLMNLLIDGDAASTLQKQTLVVQPPSGRTVYVTRRGLPLLDAQQQVVGTISVFHDITHQYQKPLPLQPSHHPLPALTTATPPIP